MKLRLAPRAGRDIREISRYLREQNPAAASRVRSAILATLRFLLAFPRLGREQTEPGVRKFVTRKYQYLVYYWIDEQNDELVVLTIQHPAMQRPFSDG